VAVHDFDHFLPFWIAVAQNIRRRARRTHMHPHNRKKLNDRVIRAAEAALAVQKYVSPVDVLVGIGWLDPGALKRWERGQVEYLEGVVQSNLPRISETMKLLRSWAAAKELTPSETHYIARTPSRQRLRFSKSANPTIEKLYRIHWISGELSRKKQERLVEKASRAPELLVIEPLNDKWKCHRCGGTGDLLIMENPGPACLQCASLDDLEFLPAGDALLTVTSLSGVYSCCRRRLGKSRFGPVRNVTRLGVSLAAFLWVGVDYLLLERAAREASRSRNATPGCRSIRP
jgi:hypothetical protein